MSYAFEILFAFFMLMALAVPAVLYFTLRGERHERMANYAAVLAAGTDAECNDAFRRVLLDMIRTEAKRKSTAANKVVATLPESDEECYKRFHHHYLPAKEKSIASMKMISRAMPLMFLSPLLLFLWRSRGGSSSFLSIVIWAACYAIMGVSFYLLFNRFIIPGTVEEVELLRQVDEKAAMVQRGEQPVPTSVPISLDDEAPGKVEKTLAGGNVPTWVAVLVIGSVLAVVAGICLYAVLIERVFEVGLMPGYKYLSDQPWKEMEAGLKELEPREALENLFVDNAGDRHLVATSFTPPSGSVLDELPGTKDQAGMEGFIQEQWGELRAEASSRGISADKITALPLDCGYVAVRISGEGTDPVDDRAATIEQVTFKKGKTCYRIILTDCNKGNLKDEVQEVVGRTRFK